MGSQSRWFRASKIVDFELFNLVSLLLLCLGFLIRPADHGNMFRHANSGAFSGEQRRSEVITVANPGAFSLKQTTSEVIAIANSTSSNSFDGPCSVCGNISSETDYGNSFQYPVSEAALFLEQKESELLSFTRAAFSNFDGRYSLIGNYSKEVVHLPPLKDWNLSRCYNLDYRKSYCRIPHSSALMSCPNVSRASTLSENSSREKFLMLIVFGSVSGIFRAYPGRETEGAILLEYDPRRLPWFMVSRMEQIEVVMDYKIPKGTSTESSLNLPSSVICLDSIPKIFLTLLRHESIEIMGINKKLRHIEECSIDNGVAYYDIGLSPDDDFELRAKVISIILAGIITLVIILIMACKRVRDLLLLKSSNELDALTSQESDLDESYLADQILYKNLLKEAKLVSEGSSGKVFKVRFSELECAMKVFHSTARMDFKKESITLLNLSHPHVVRFFCSFRKSFIIMELMDEDLYSFITKIRERRINYDMPLEVALDVMLQIAEGMSYLHHQGIAHQDLKSLNILLKLRGEFDDPDFQIIAKVADFGSARRFDPRYPTGFVLVPNMNIGTRSWRAPELFHPRGSFWTRSLGLNPRVLSKPLDIYGFAVICSELLTKKIPFSNDEYLRVAFLASKLREGHRPALPSTGCPEGLLALIKDCWHRDPLLRPEFHEVCTRLIEVRSSLMSRGQRSES